MSTDKRHETTLDHVATIIQSARKGESTPHEAAARVLYLIANTTPTPRSGLMTPSPSPQTPSDKDDSPSSLLPLCRALIDCVTPTRQPFGAAFRDHHGDRIEISPAWAAFKATVREVEADSPGQATVTHLLKCAQEVVALVEGPHAPRWSAGGLRLKDTREWCAFYVAVKAAEREAEGAPPVPGSATPLPAAEAQAKEAPSPAPLVRHETMSGPVWCSRGVDPCIAAAPVSSQSTPSPASEAPAIAVTPAERCGHLSFAELAHLAEWAESILCNALPMPHCDAKEWGAIIKKWRDKLHGAGESKPPAPSPASEPRSGCCGKCPKPEPLDEGRIQQAEAWEAVWSALQLHLPEMIAAVDVPSQPTTGKQTAVAAIAHAGVELRKLRAENQRLSDLSAYRIVMDPASQAGDTSVMTKVEMIPGRAPRVVEITRPAPQTPGDDAIST